MTAVLAALRRLVVGEPHGDQRSRSAWVGAALGGLCFGLSAALVVYVLLLTAGPDAMIPSQVPWILEFLALPVGVYTGWRLARARPAPNLARGATRFAVVATLSATVWIVGLFTAASIVEGGPMAVLILPGALIGVLLFFGLPILIATLPTGLLWSLAFDRIGQGRIDV